MRRDAEVYLKDILSSIEKIEIYCDGRSYQDFAADSMRVDAVARNLEVIGEAAKHVPEKIRKDYPEIEWRKIAGLRDILIHEYFGINLKIIWDVVKKKLPVLKSNIQKILRDVE